MTVTRRSLLLGGAAVGLGIAPAPEPAPTRTRTQSVSALPPALFIAAHPDDETLAMGVAIAEHVAAGQDVHLLWLTRGDASGVRDDINGTGTNGTWWGVIHDPAAEGYTPLSPAQFGAARVREGTNALACLGDITIHEAGLPDGAVTQSAAESAIVAVADQIAPGDPVRLKVHSHTVDNHPDHLAAGNAALSLGDNNPARFDDRRYYILPTYWTDPRLSQVTESWDNPGSAEIEARAINACRAFGAWSPPRTYAIGFHSVPDLWPPLMAQPRCLQHD